MGKRKTQAQQPELFAPTVRYGWKSVRTLKKHDLVVIGQEEVTVASIKQEGREWMIVYTDGATPSKMEQVYHDHDCVYARLEADKHE